MSSPNISFIDALRKFRFIKKISLDAGNSKSEEGHQENRSSGKSDLDISGGGDFNAISSILDMKKKVNRILSDSESDLSDGPMLKPRRKVINGIKSDDEEEKDEGEMKANGSESTEDDSKTEIYENGVKEHEDVKNVHEDVKNEEINEEEICSTLETKGTNEEKSKESGSRKRIKKPKTKSYHVDLDGEVIVGGQTTEEKALMALIKMCPTRDPITLQDLLLRSEWNVEAAAQKAEEEEQKRNISPTKRKSNGKRRRMDDSDEDSDSADDGNMDDNGSKLKKRKVFDSDADSDEEVSNSMVGDEDRKAVLEFFSNGKIAEFQLMAGCSKKKADIMYSLKPFADWDDLVSKLESTPQVNADFLNKAQEVLATRATVEKLIKECLVLSGKLEKAVATELTNVIKQPELLSNHLTLSDYQLIGLNWLTIMHRNRLNAILADEMGLGKTIQIIAFLAWLKEHKRTKPGCPHLIVVPAATLDNWNNEIVRWCPSMKVEIYHGSQDERRYLRYEWKNNGFGETDIILATYNIVASTNEEKKFFCKRTLHYAIFDEAHMLKNMATKRYQSLINISASNRVLLTGTPLQNNLLELMSLCIFVMPKMFDKKEKSLQNFFTKTASSREGNDDDLPEFELKQISLARDIMKPFVLRRLKDDVLKDLPTKTTLTRLCSMLPDQEKKYNELIVDFTKQAGSVMEADDEFRDSGIAMYMKLRRLANHPLLLRYLYGEEDIQKFANALSTDLDYKDTKVEYIVDDLSFMSDFDIHQLTKKYTSCSGWGLKSEDIVKSGKFAELDELLPKLKEEGHRVLFFSQFVIVLDIVEEYLQIRGHKYLRLDGNTPVTIRQDLIDEYNRDHSIFLFMITTRAGGLGINLTSADTVIIHDIDSNPQNDKQAEDRSHRIGQTRPVSVIRLISKGTIEENIHQMGLEKLKLEREISNTEENESSEKKSVASLLRQVLGLDKNKTPAKSSVDS